MASTRTAATGEQERAQTLLSLGFSPTQALLLAATQNAGVHVDVDRLRWMLDGGCDHDLALRILL